MSKTFETPKGTRDFLPDEMQLRRTVFDRLRRAFELFGYDEWDTPAFEYLDVLTLKAGPQAEEEIYSFVDKGGRKLGLRFDLTSSTGRVAAAHPELRRPLYRYQIGKVWRYDRPGAGRYREFYQADADILGSASMNCEVDLMLLADFVLREFGLSECVFLLNHRKILDAQLQTAGIAPSQKSAALRALDKLDKRGWDGIQQEAVQYGIDPAAFTNFLALLGITPEQRFPIDALEHLDHLSSHLSSPDGQTGIEQLRYIFRRAQALGLTQRIRLDPTLARGLDYYTGPIFEARAGVGQGFLSFAGGGRYDDLIALYGGPPQGAVGFSFGVERLVELVRERITIGIRRSQRVFVAALSETCLDAAQKLAMRLRQAGITARWAVQAASPHKHLQQAQAAGAEWFVVVGEQEQTTNRYPVKHLPTFTEKVLPVDDLVSHLQVGIIEAGSSQSADP